MFFGHGSVGRTFLRPCSKYADRTWLKLSPCGVPTLPVNGFDVKVPFILVSMSVPLRRNCISLRSSSSTNDFTIPRRWRLFIVSKAVDISMPGILIVVSSFSAFEEVGFIYRLIEMTEKKIPKTLILI